MSSSRNPASLPRRPIQLHSFAPVSQTMRLPDVESGSSPRQHDHAYAYGHGHGHGSYITPPPSPQYSKRDIEDKRQTNSPRQYLNTPSQDAYSPSSSSSLNAPPRSPSKSPQQQPLPCSHHPDPRYYSSQQDPRLGSSSSSSSGPSRDCPPYAPCTFYAPLPPMTDSYSYPSPPHRSSDIY